MCHQICEKLISDILDYIIQTVHHDMKSSNFFKKIPYMLKFAKKIETFCIYIAVKVFLKTLTKGSLYTINKLKHICNFELTAKLLEFLNANVTLPLLKIFLFLNETEINIIFCDQLNNIDLFAALLHLFYTPVITNTNIISQILIVVFVHYAV